MFASGRKKLAGARSGQGKGGGAGLSFIGPDVVVSGDLTTAGSIHIDGRIEGNVRCENLIQGEGGTIAGHIVTDDAHLSGLVDGTVKARVVTLESSARITGDLTYETLSIAAGAAIEGRLARREGGPGAELTVPAPPAPPALEKKRGRPIRSSEPSLLPAIEIPAAAPAL
jgi:cytoskeletal protein CcmA (bactofilin family)